MSKSGSIPCKPCFTARAQCTRQSARWLANLSPDPTSPSFQLSVRFMSEPAGQAVFISYASQDAGAARRVCEALQMAGVEVWFDQSELVGGDAWDAKIRRQIK